ncbi:ABC transporter substrate-binding protein [Corynebacterium macginleyi]|uniref:ABC transporter substrate-binding protein n=1 Tax=Corynebacterium macginleyi TaxID=38290 RepID=UPI00190BCED2|nr:ABC transporter substrate-binding protein [Corynebacterium macginleyi]MBK4148778.1 transporter substrate-binding domain-containing protein [Corynebacterium macginleyi]MBK4160056.1 transporter substrate-binding domain-containing protein [Corynebacterium macginleyi]MBK4178669.1 transporter substrate-binding domain-containing protein [Corynebacterium macginleyi]
MPWAIKHRPLATAIMAFVLPLSACVVNEEDSTPQGWQEPKTREVPKIAAMYHDDDGVLTAGTNPPYAPFQLKDSNGDLQGVELDLARAVAGVLGLKFQAVEQDFSMILPAVQSGQIDMGASGFTDTADRRGEFDFVDHLYAGIQWAELVDGPKKVDPQNPCGLTVAVQRTTVSETDDVRPKQDSCDGDLTVLSYDTGDNAALAVLMGRADALSADSPVTAWAVNRSEGKMRVVGDIFQASPYGFAVPKDSDLAKAAAAALQHLIDNGEYAKILARWGIEDGLVDQAMINERPING